jgi:transposase
VGSVEAQEDREALLARIRDLEAALATTTTTLASTTSKLDTVTTKLAQTAGERDRYRKNYELLLEQHELLKRRLFVAKAERADVTQLELEFAETKAKLDELAGALGIVSGEDVDAAPAGGDERGSKKGKRRGRRNLHDTDLPKERVELTDPEFEGRFESIGFEESSRLAYRRGGPVHMIVARKIYKTTGDDGAVTLVTTARPKELLQRCFASPSMLAHLLFEKYGMGVPFYRQESRAEYQAVGVDRGTMSRYAEDAGASLGPIVEACAAEARNAFCLSTDATGIAIQPTPLAEGKRQPCRKGHFFVVLADRDHIFFEYQPKHTSAAVCEMFRGYSGFIQADAHAIYDALFRGEANAGADAPTEVGCWSHARRKFWEAAISKHAIGAEGLYRIGRMFEVDASWADEPPSRRRDLRRAKLGPLLDDFFDWVRSQENVHRERGLVATALGYARRQEKALRRFLDDGRLRMDNNAAERGLRPIATGRKNWLFFGSDDHAHAAANLFSLIASAKLHALDPESYLAEIIRVMPYWPRGRHLELAPKYWAATRARLDPREL